MINISTDSDFCFDCEYRRDKKCLLFKCRLARYDGNFERSKCQHCKAMRARRGHIAKYRHETINKLINEDLNVIFAEEEDHKYFEPDLGSDND